MADTIYRIISTETLAVNSASVASVAVSQPGFYRLYTDQTCHVKTGTVPTAMHTDFPLYSNKYMLLSLAENEKVAVLSHTATNQLWDAGIREDDSASSFKDYTSKLNSETADDVPFFPAGAGVDDVFYFGSNKRFSKITLEIGVAGAGTYTVAWEYWDGLAWSAVAGLSDGTSALQIVGENVVSFTLPSDWEETDVHTGSHLYFIRVKRDGGTVTTNPLGSYALPLTPVGEVWLSRVDLS